MPDQIGLLAQYPGLISPDIMQQLMQPGFIPKQSSQLLPPLAGPSFEQAVNEARQVFSDLGQRTGSGLMNYLRWNLMGSPGSTPGEIGVGMINSAANAGRIMTTAPLAPPAGSVTDDAGMISQGRADPAAWQAFIRDQNERQNLGPSTAAAMIGGGASFAERGALGAAGGRALIPAVERITGAAIRHEGNIYSDINHVFALDRAKKAGADMNDVIKNGQEGFLTSEGRFVDRKQAVDIANAADQWAKYGTVGPSEEALQFMRDRGITREALEPLPGLSNQPFGIRAYHGSPYDFDRFDMSKIGTGEGRQEYGHGLYFTRNPNLAEAYKNDPLSLSFGRFEGEERPKPGRMYEVNINADPEHFIDLDKPLSEQSEHVRNALRGMNMLPDNTVGLQLAQRFHAGERPERTSEILRNAGIPGLKYLEGETARGGTAHNYVVFDDKLIDIIKKYGIAGLGTYLGASQIGKESE
jgi:hypothetical protein